jgi:hypothetical protein
MKIIRGRLKPQAGTTYEFISVKSRIKHLIEKSRGDNFDFVIEIDGRKAVKSFGPDHLTPELIGQEVPIISEDIMAKFNEDGTIDIVESIKESLPRKNSIDQLKKVRKASKKTDIGDKIGNWGTNPIDTGVESYEDFEKKNKGFIPGWNLKHLKSPFKTKSKK